MFDGSPTLAISSPHKGQLISRYGNVFRGFADLATWIAEHLHVENVVLDGEIASVDDNGRPVFRDLLFRRRQCVFTAFELLYLNGKDLRTLPTLLAPELGEASSANLATITTSIELLAAGRELHASSSIHKST